MAQAPRLLWSRRTRKALDHGVYAGRGEEIMWFMLRDVGLECFTLVLKAEGVGAVLTDDDHDQPWIATLHRAHSPSALALPAPFKTSLHRFASLTELKVWLGISATAGVVEGAV